MYWVACFAYKRIVESKSKIALFFFTNKSKIASKTLSSIFYFISRVYLQNSEIHLNFIVYVKQHSLWYKILLVRYGVEGGRGMVGGQGQFGGGGW